MNCFLLSISYSSLCPHSRPPPTFARPRRPKTDLFAPVYHSSFLPLMSKKYTFYIARFKLSSAKFLVSNLLFALYFQNEMYWLFYFVLSFQKCLFATVFLPSMSKTDLKLVYHDLRKLIPRSWY